MTDIDVCTTATLRPELLDLTYSSFCTRLLRPNLANYRCIINVDPIGDDVDPMEVVRVAQKHFRKVSYNVSDSSHFSRAFAWCWRQAEADYVFHLEDDWELLADLDLLDMLRLMEENETLALLRLNLFSARKDTCRQWNRHIPWNENAGYFEIPKEQVGKLGYSGNPSLIRLGFVRQMIPWLNDRFCPEKTLKSYIRPVHALMLKWRYGIYQKPFDKRAIRDIGRAWRQPRLWYKHRGHTFHTWERMQEGYTEKEWYRKLKEEKK